MQDPTEVEVQEAIIGRYQELIEAERQDIADAEEQIEKLLILRTEHQHKLQELLDGH